MYAKVMLGLLGSAVLAFPVLAETVTIAPDRMLTAGEKRVFVLGLYENPTDDAVLQQVAEAGFNLVQAKADAAALDRLKQHGLYAWINVGAAIDFSEDQPADPAKAGTTNQRQLQSLADSCGAHPALLAWEVPDEALWNCWYGPMRWRTELEPKEQSLKFDALDAALVTQLKADQAEVQRLWNRGDYAAAEELANGIWRKMNMDPPNPGLNVSESAQKAATMCAGMREGYAFLKRIDPRHPIWMNHAPRNQKAQLAAFNEAADIVGCDIYPVTEYQGGHSGLADRSLSTVGAHTTYMQDAAPGKPVWMVIQGFGWPDIEEKPTAESRAKNKRPTFDESRFMAYDAIVHGARGLLYWGTAYIEKDSDLWRDLLKLVRELADLQPVLSAPDAALTVSVSLAETWGTCDRDVQILTKDVGGKIWIIVANESPDCLHYTLDGLTGLEGTLYGDSKAAREARVLDGKLRLAIEGHGVQVLEPRSGK